MKEFNLSSKIQAWMQGKVILKEDVKEFIRLLKKHIRAHGIIDQLAGEELVK